MIAVDDSKGQIPSRDQDELKQWRGKEKAAKAKAIKMTGKEKVAKLALSQEKNAKERAAKQKKQALAAKERVVKRNALQEVETTTPAAYKEEYLAQRPIIIGFCILLMICLIGLCIMLFLFMRPKEENIRTVAMLSEKQVLLSKTEVSEVHRRRIEEEWIKYKRQAQEDGAWIYWVGGDSNGKGHARLNNGYVCFNRFDLTDSDQQYRLMRFNVGKEFVFFADEKEYLGKVIVAPVVNDKGEIYLKTDAPYTHDHSTGVFYLSAFDHVYYKQTRLFFYTDSFIRTWPPNRMREYAVSLVGIIGSEEIGSSVPEQDDHLFGWILDVQNRFLHVETHIMSIEEKLRLLEITRHQLRTKEPLHCDALVWMANTAVFDLEERWGEEMSRIVEALKPLENTALVITITTDGNNPNAQTANQQGRLEDLLTAREESVKRKLMEVGLTEKLLFVGAPRYKYQDKSGIHSKLILEPLTVEEGARRQAIADKRRRELEASRSLNPQMSSRGPRSRQGSKDSAVSNLTLATQPPSLRSATSNLQQERVKLFVDTRFLPGEDQFSQQEQEKVLIELRKASEKFDVSSDIVYITITTTEVDEAYGKMKSSPRPDENNGSSKLVQLLEARAKTIQKLWQRTVESHGDTKAGVLSQQTKIMEPILGHDSDMVILACESQQDTFRVETRE